MKSRKLLLWCAVLVALSCVATAQVPKWSLDVGEQIKDYNFLKDGAYLFLTNYEYSWLFDASSGAKVYELRVKGYEKKGLHNLVGEQFLISVDDELRCYDALTGKLTWKQEYNDISQDEFKDLEWLDQTCVIRFGSMHLGVDLESGKELWRTKIVYNGDVREKGGWNYKLLNKQKLLLVLMEDDQLGLFQFSDGQRIFTGKEYEISGDLLKKGRTYSYVSPDERYVVFLLDEQVAVVDVVEKKELPRLAIKYDNDYEAVMPTDLGCAILGKDKIIFFNDSTGALTEVKASVGDFRTYNVMRVGNKDVFFAGLSDAMFAIDLAAGNVLWESKKDDPNFEGYMHRYLKIDGTNLIGTYTVGSGAGGTKLFLESIDALTGKVNFRSACIFNSRIYTPGWVRSMGKFMMEKIAKQEHSFGYENIGFDYTVMEHQANLVFSTVSMAKMLNPETTDEGGEGVVVVDPATGKFLFKDYVQVTDYVGWTNQPNQMQEMKPVIVDNYIFLLGDENIAGYDFTTPKRLFHSKKTLKGVPRDAMLLDGILYVKFGERRFNVALDPPSGIFGYLGMKVNDRWDKDPYGFAAYDIADGKLLWRTETKVDPGFLTPAFSLKNNYDAGTKHLYFADEENIYALQMARDGGKNDFVINLDKAGLGEMPFKKTYAIQEWPIGSINVSVSTGYGYTVTTTTAEIGGHEYNKFISNLEEADAYTTYKGWARIWGAVAKKCLRAVYYDKYIFAIGKEAIAMMNSADGKIMWKHPWEYDQDNVQYMPRILNDKLVYCVERKLTSVDLKTGETLWQNKEAKRPLFFNSPNEKFLYVIDEEVIRGYELEKQK